MIGKGLIAYNSKEFSSKILVKNVYSIILIITMKILKIYIMNCFVKQ